MQVHIPIRRTAIWGHRLAAFEQAGRRGPVELIFTDPTLPIAVKVGDRFIGYVTPEREARRLASDALRDDSGVMAGGQS